MSIATYGWLRTGHVIGFVCWIAGMVTVLELLRVHAHLERQAAREVLARHERKAGILMDAGATLALICGFWLAFGGTVNAFKTGGWIHLKVTLVALVLLGTHGWSRVQIRRFRHGDIRPIPPWLTAVVLVAAAAIIALGANPTLLRK